MLGFRVLRFQVSALTTGTSLGVFGLGVGRLGSQGSG